MKLTLTLIFVIWLGMANQGPMFIKASEQRDATYYQRIADSSEWKWHDAESSIVYSITHCSAPYEIDVIHQPQRPGERITIHFSKAGRQAWKWDGHWHSVFIVSSSTLVYADYNMGDSGCDVVAVDLEKSRQLWRSRVGFGPTNHSWYANEVAMNMGDDVVVITGNETAGAYIAIVDIMTGKLLDRKNFPKAKK